MKFFISFVLFILALGPLEAAVLKSVGKGKGIISLRTDENVEVGKTYYLLDFSGQAIGKVKIKKVNNDTAIVLISKSAKGKAKIGYKIDTDTSVESGTMSDKNEDQKSVKQTSVNNNFTNSFSLYSEGKVTGILGAKLSHTLDSESFFTAQIGRLGFKNEEDNVQEGWQVLVGYGLPLNGQAFGSGFKVEAQLGYVSTKLSFTDQFSAEYEASLSGTILGAHGAYHWSFETFFLDLGLTLNYYMLDDEVPVETGYIEKTPLSGINLLLHLGFGLHF